MSTADHTSEVPKRTRPRYLAAVALMALGLLIAGAATILMDAPLATVAGWELGEDTLLWAVGGGLGCTLAGSALLRWG